MPEAESIEPDETQSLDTRLIDVSEQYMTDRRAGTAPRHAEIIARHPDIADELKSCLEGIDLLGDDPDGKPLLGWRVTILPYVEQAALAKAVRMDKTWEAPENKVFSEMAIPVFSGNMRGTDHPTKNDPGRPGCRGAV